jgi:CheY-like chemotaxis protein
MHMDMALDAEPTRPVGELNEELPCVLVVDDDEGIRETLRFLLEDAGHDVLEATDGFAALRVLRASAEPLVVLLDFMMPGLDGAGVLRAVAQDATLAGMHSYIVITADARAANLLTASLPPRLSVPVIRKPFDIDLLLDTIAEAARRIAPPPPR